MPCRCRFAVLVSALVTVIGFGAGARADTIYDFSGAHTGNTAFKGTTTGPIPPTTNTIPSTPFETADYTAVSASDNSRQTTTSTGSTFALTRFVFTVNESAASLLDVNVQWEGNTASGGTVDLLIWNASTSTYTLLGSTSSTTDTTLTFAATNPTQVIDGSSQVTVLVANTVKNKDVNTDHVRISVRQCASDANCNDDNVCTNDICSSGFCTHPNNTAACSDGNPCTVGDVCNSGTCQSGPAPDCSGPSDQCNVASCDPAGSEGNCNIRTPVADNTPCDDDRFCTVDEACQAGGCTGNPRNCSHLTNQCNTGVCDETANDCFAEPVPNDTDCDDATACLVGESCQNGQCASGSTPDCSSFADQCNTAPCDPAGPEGNCDTITPVANGTGCDDSDACNVGEACRDGACGGGSAPDCSSSGNQCNTASCDSTGAEGNCNTLTPVPNDTACDDGNACNVQEACQDGECTGGGAPNCTSAGDQCNTASCDPAGPEGNCNTLTPVADETVCNDGDACLVGEFCRDGVCGGGSAPDCSLSGDQCLVASCDPSGAEGNCATLTPVADETPCNDDRFCTAIDLCRAGECNGSGNPCPLFCDTGGDVCVECLDGGDCNDGVDCTDDTCESGQCVYTANNSHCPDDGDYCNGTEYCDNEADCRSTGDPCPVGQLCDEDFDTCGECVVDADCDDGVACTDDTCVDHGCSYAPDDDNCPDDGSYCSGAESCDAKAGCVSSGNPCTAEEFCNDETRTCDECRVDEDCADDDPCTAGHACVAGECQAGAAVDCSLAGDQCNTASCDPEGAEGNCAILTPVQNGTPCNDGDSCKIHESCQGGACEGGGAPNCTASGDQCNMASCDPAGAEGNCDILTPVADDTVCDDGNACNVGESCRSGECVGGSAPDCSSSGDQCNGASCDPAGQEGNCDGRTPLSDGTSCNDGNACNVGESCQSGECVGGSAPDCSSSGDQCNTASCDPTGSEGNCDSRTPVPNESVCDDGNSCTTVDLCIGGTCIGTPTYNLNDWKRMQECLAGPDTAIEPGCNCFDFDQDDDVDMKDVAEFIGRFEGS